MVKRCQNFPKLLVTELNFRGPNITEVPIEEDIVKVLTEQVVHRMGTDVADLELMSDIEAAKRFMQIIGGTENRFFVSGQDEFDKRIAEIDIALENLKNLNKEPKMSTVMPPVQENVILVTDESANAMI